MKQCNNFFVNQLNVTEVAKLNKVDKLPHLSMCCKSMNCDLRYIGYIFNS